MRFTTKSILRKSEGIYKDKGSKFLAFAIPVQSEEEVKTLLQQYRKDYFDARHVCYAYMLGAEHDCFRANDDGEPSGTAGRPILGQINSLELTNILVVVVRYFGGILLGTSGLIVAYREATLDALQKAEIIEQEITALHQISFPYPLTQTVMRALKDHNARQIQTDYTNTQCILSYEVPLSSEELLLNRLKATYGVTLHGTPDPAK